MNQCLVKSARETLNGRGYVKKKYTLISNWHGTRESEMNETHDPEARTLNSFYSITKEKYFGIITLQTEKGVTFAFFTLMSLFYMRIVLQRENHCKQQDPRRSFFGYLCSFCSRGIYLSFFLFICLPVKKLG